MNFLAHLYLSGDSNEIKLGNMIGDFVKGKQYLLYPVQVQHGILLHRQIDTFTDQHPLVNECAELLRPVYKKYAGIIVDLYFDHFLACHWNQYSDITLKEFASQTHSLLLKNFFILPSQLKRFLPFLIKNKRLQSYATIEGIIEVIEIMSNYTSLPREKQFATQVLTENYDFLHAQFDAFMPDMVDFVNNYLSNNQEFSK